MTFAFVLTFAAVAAVGGFQVCPGETLSTFRRVSSQRDEPRNAPQRLIKSQVVGPSPSPEPLSISKQVLSSFDGRDLRNDVVLGITEGVIFEACKGKSLFSFFSSLSNSNPHSLSPSLPPSLLLSFQL